QALDALRAQEHLEPGFREVAEVLASSLAQAEDAAHSLQAYLRKTDLDPQRLAQLDERMASWLTLARRYKRAPADLPALLAGWKTTRQGWTAPPTGQRGKGPRRRRPRASRRGHAAGPRPGPRRRRRCRNPAPRRCRAWACRAAASRWRWKRWRRPAPSAWKK